MDRLTQWVVRIVRMLEVRNKMYIADKEQLWEYYYPEVAANTEDVESLQKRLNIRLSQDYIDFLLRADGRKRFYQDVDLFGTQDFDTEIMTYAKQLLNIELEYHDSLCQIKDDLLPVAVSRTDKDLFVMVLTEGEDFGKIVWLAGGEIDRFSSFVEFFDSMMEYNRLDLESMLNERLKNKTTRDLTDEERERNGGIL